MIKLFINAATQTNPRKSANTPGKKKKGSRLEFCGCVYLSITADAQAGSKRWYLLLHRWILPVIQLACFQKLCTNNKYDKLGSHLPPHQKEGSQECSASELINMLKLTGLMRVHTSVFSRRIYLNTRQREISIRPCTAWLDVCPWYYWLLWIMKRAKDYRAAFLQEVARQTMSFSSSPSSRIDRLVLRGMNLWWRAEQPSQHLTAGRALPDCCRDDRLTLGRVGVADPRGAGGSVPRRRTCWGRLTLIHKKKGGESNTGDVFYFAGKTSQKYFMLHIEQAAE